MDRRLRRIGEHGRARWPGAGRGRRCARGDAVHRLRLGPGRRPSPTSSAASAPRLRRGDRRPLRPGRPRRQAGRARRGRPRRSPAAPAGVISVLGATPLATLEPALAPTAASCGRCPTSRSRSVTASSATRRSAEERTASSARRSALLGSLGTSSRSDEELLDPATAVMGCAPAYIALAVEALIEAGVEAGLDQELSARLVREATAGRRPAPADPRPGAMQRAIASPGGSTEAGLDALASASVARRASRPRSTPRWSGWRERDEHRRWPRSTATTSPTSSTRSSSSSSSSSSPRSRSPGSSASAARFPTTGRCAP